MTNTDYLTRQIEEQYNPEHDCPAGPVQVTWADYHLLEITKDLQEQIDAIKEANKTDEVKALEAELDQMREDYRRCANLLNDVMVSIPTDLKSNAISRARDFLVEWYS